MTRRPISIARLLSERARGDGTPAQPEEAVSGVLEGLQRLAEGLGEAVRQAAAAPEGEQRFVVGYSVKVGPLGTRAEPFGHVAPAARAAHGSPAARAAHGSPAARGAPDAPAAQAARGTPLTREPLTDVFEEADAIVVVAEVPGAGEGSLSARVVEDALLIESAAPHTWRKRVPLPGAVDAARLTLSCRNGILEVRLPRPEGPA